MKTLPKKPTALKPCPFCGGEGEFNLDDRSKLYVVECKEWGCTMMYGKTEGDCAKAWNTRANAAPDTSAEAVATPQCNQVYEPNGDTWYTAEHLHKLLHVRDEYLVEIGRFSDFADWLGYGQGERDVINLPFSKDDSKEGWTRSETIQWSGGDCPVAPNTPVSIWFRGGGFAKYRIAKEAWWDCRNCEGDIVAYAVLHPSPSPDGLEWGRHDDLLYKGTRIGHLTCLLSDPVQYQATLMSKTIGVYPTEAEAQSALESAAKSWLGIG